MDKSGKVTWLFPPGIANAQQYLRKQFLEMYKQNPAYFVSTSNTRSFWTSINNGIPINNVDDLNIFLNSSNISSR